MKKFFLALFILFDLGLMGASAFVIYAHLTHSTALRALPIPQLAKMPALTHGSSPSASSTTSTSVSTSTVKPSAGPLAVAAGTPSSATRNIGFSYRNPHAKQVFIRADFTGWKAEPMKKGPNGVWTYSTPLSPGEYAYCYTADDKTFKDPNNKRTKQIGRTMVSAIVVEPLNAKPAPAK